MKSWIGPRRPTVYVTLVLAFALIASACWSGSMTDAVESGDLSDLSGIEELATAFNDDAGIPRLILSLSPT